MPIPPPKGSTNHTREDTPKRLIVCCDGTGQSSSHGEATVPTNVTRLCRALETSEFITFKQHPVEVQQVILYQTGIGTDSVTSVSGVVAEAFGVGLDTHVLEAYNFFANNYEKGDELFLFGFSRGAFTARAIASFICNAGLLKGNHIALLPGLWKAYKEYRRTIKSQKAEEDWKRIEKDQGPWEGKRHLRVPIKILGVWDTVGSLGLPETWLSGALKVTGLRTLVNDSFNFHDTSLPTGSIYAKIERAYQALALDEHRVSFRPTLLYYRGSSDPTDSPITPPEVHNCWFAGVHTDVGGGYERAYRDISDLTFVWMIDQIGGDLAFKNNMIADLENASLDAESLKPRNLGRNSWGTSKLHDSMDWKFKLGGSQYRSPGQYLHDHKDRSRQKHYAIETIHPSVRSRMQSAANPDDKKVESYNPLALAGFTLRKEVEEDMISWSWVKTLDELDENGENKVIKLPEYVMSTSEGALERQLLDHADWKTLDDRDADKKIKFVPKPLPWSWILRSYVPLGFPLLALSSAKP